MSTSPIKMVESLPPPPSTDHVHHAAGLLVDISDSRGPCFCRKIIGMCEARTRPDKTSEVSTICAFWPQNDGFCCKLLWLRLNSRPILWTFNKHQGFVVHVWVQTSQKISPFH